MQERGQESLTSSTRREIERQIKRLGRDDGATVGAPSLKAGTRLALLWRGRMNQVLVLEDGFEFDGRRYPAQMAAAASRPRIRLALPETKRVPRNKAPANSGAF